MFLEDIIRFGLEALQNFCICTLSLTIAFGVGRRSEAELDAHDFAIITKQLTSELGAIVRNNTIWHTKPCCDAFDKSKGRVFIDLSDRVSIGPLSKLINSHIKMLIAPNC